MKLFINRILYSCYCLERWSCFFMSKVCRPIIVQLHKLMYRWDPFNIIKKRNKNFEEYLQNGYRDLNQIFNNLDYGTNMMRSESSLVFVFVPYLMFIASVLKYFKVSFFAKANFNIYLIVSFGISSLVCYIASFRNDVFKRYFKRFEKRKSNTKWHLLVFFIFVVAIGLVFLSIILWNK